MRRSYEKPMLYAESFRLMEHMAANCGYITNFGSGCPIVEGGITFFVSQPTCSEDAEMMWTKAGVVDLDNRTIENLSLLKVQCYNSFADFSMLFNS